MIEQLAADPRTCPAPRAGRCRGWRPAAGPPGRGESTTARAVKPKEDSITQNMIGQSPAMQRIFRLIGKIAPTESPVLVTGESTTGKEMIAASIHLQSRRAHLPFVAVNSSAIPETLFESELFGHVRGSFTGATSDRVGLMEHADRGTIFFDEVAEMPLSVQVKLLRALQSGEVRRVGAKESMRVD